MLEFFKKHPWAETLFIAVISIIASTITSVITAVVFTLLQ